MRIYSGCFSVIETATIHSVKPVITGYLLYKEDFLRYTIFSKLNVISILAYMDFRKEDDTVVMDYTKRIYMLTAISFFVGTSQFVIVGVLDKVAASLGVSLGTAGQLVTAFALANAVGAPLLIPLLGTGMSSLFLHQDSVSTFPFSQYLISAGPSSRCSLSCWYQNSDLTEIGRAHV